MKRLYAFLHLFLFGLILVHTVIPHTHEDDPLSEYPALTATASSHLLFLQIDLGEDHLEEYDQNHQDFVFIVEVVSIYSTIADVKSLISPNQPEKTYTLSFNQSTRGPPAA